VKFPSGIANLLFLSKVNSLSEAALLLSGERLEKMITAVLSKNNHVDL